MDSIPRNEKYTLPIFTEGNSLYSYAHNLDQEWRNYRPLYEKILDYIQFLGFDWDSSKDILIFNTEEDRLAFLLRYS